MKTFVQKAGHVAACAFIAAAIAVPVTAQEDDDPVIAIVNDYQLRMSDVNAQISRMPLGDQVSVRSDPEKFAESLIQEEVLFQFALKDGETDLELREELKALIVNHVIDKYVTQSIEVTDAEIQDCLLYTSDAADE